MPCDSVDRFVETVVAAEPWTGLADLPAADLARFKDAAGTGCLLDRGAAAREVATFVALVLLRADGAADTALELCEEVAEVAPPQSPAELDVVSVGGQAIRDALSLRGTNA